MRILVIALTLMMSSSLVSAQPIAGTNDELTCYYDEQGFWNSAEAGDVFHIIFPWHVRDTSFIGNPTVSYALLVPWENGRDILTIFDADGCPHSTPTGFEGLLPEGRR